MGVNGQNSQTVDRVQHIPMQRRPTAAPTQKVPYHHIPSEHQDLAFSRQTRDPLTHPGYLNQGNNVAPVMQNAFHRPHEHNWRGSSHMQIADEQVYENRYEPPFRHYQPDVLHSNYRQHLDVPRQLAGSFSAPPRPIYSDRDRNYAPHDYPPVPPVSIPHYNRQNIGMNNRPRAAYQHRVPHIPPNNPNIGVYFNPSDYPQHQWY
jgi:hypothetical protein